EIAAAVGPPFRGAGSDGRNCASVVIVSDGERSHTPGMTLRVGMLAYPDVQMLDVMGPLEVFARTSRWLRDKGRSQGDAYDIEIIGLQPGPFRASSGLRLYADRRFGEVRRGVDTLLIAGGVGTRRYCTHPPLIRWIRKQAGWVRRLASVCTGSFFLAEAGLLK